MLAAQRRMLVRLRNEDAISDEVLATIERDVTLLVVTSTDDLDAHMDAHIELQEEDS